MSLKRSTQFFLLSEVPSILISLEASYIEAKWAYRQLCADFENRKLYSIFPEFYSGNEPKSSLIFGFMVQEFVKFVPLLLVIGILAFVIGIYTKDSDTSSSEDLAKLVDNEDGCE